MSEPNIEVDSASSKRRRWSDTFQRNSRRRLLCLPSLFVRGNSCGTISRFERIEVAWHDDYYAPRKYVQFKCAASARLYYSLSQEQMSSLVWARCGDARASARRRNDCYVCILCVVCVVNMRMRTYESVRKCMWYGIAAPLYRFRVAVTGAEVQTPPFTADGAVLPSWLRWFHRSLRKYTINWRFMCIRWEAIICQMKRWV